MNAPGTDDTGGLGRRVEELESELRALRERVAALEQVRVPVLTPTPTPISQPRLVTEPAPMMRKASEPPPLPKTIAPRPAVVLPPPPPPVPVPEEPSALVTFLRAVRLLPPAGGGSAEVQLGAWWATRIGALVFVIGAVFFGAYLSIGTPPWVKLAELTAIAVGMTLAGGWIERHAARVGRVVEGAGLALIFFTAFAAYAVPAVKVIDSRVVGFAVQAAAVVLVFAAAVRRRSSTVASMAMLLGFVSAFYSVAPGFDGIAVLGALTLTVAAVGLRRWQGWALPLGLAAVLAPLVQIAVAWLVWDAPLNRAPAWFAFGVLAVTFAAVFASLLTEKTDADGRVPRAQHWIQSLHAGLAALAGWVTAAVVLPGSEVAMYFFVAAAVLAGAAVWMWRRVPADSLGSLFAVKASALLALGVVTEWEARTRWIVLLVEAFVLLAAARRMQRRALNVTAVLAWLVALLFFFAEAGAGEHAQIWGESLAMGLFAIGGTAFCALSWRWWPEAVERGDRWTSALLVGLAAAPAIVRTAQEFANFAWGAAAFVAIVGAVLVLARLLRSIVALAGAAVALVCAHVLVHDFGGPPGDARWLWSGAISLALLTAALGWRAGEIEAQRQTARTSVWQRLGAVLVALALAAVGAALFQSLETRMAVGCVAALTAAAALLAVMLGRSFVGGAAILALAAGVVQFFQYWNGEVTTAVGWLWAAAVGAAVVLASGTWERRPATAWSYVLDLSGVGAAVILSHVAADATFGIVGLTWCLAGIGVLYLAWGMWRQTTPALAAGSLLPVVAMIATMLRFTWPPLEAPWLALGGAFMAALVLAAGCVGIERHATWLGTRARRLWSVGGAVLAALFVVHLGLQRPAPWAAVTSVVWVAGGIAVFALGLFFRSRSHRVTGLVLLAVCIPRVFLFDITSTFFRIVAFVVLGAVLIWVGFSYQRFRHLIEGDRAGADTGAPPPV